MSYIYLWYGLLVMLAIYVFLVFFSVCVLIFAS